MKIGALLNIKFSEGKCGKSRGVHIDAYWKSFYHQMEAIFGKYLFYLSLPLAECLHPLCCLFRPQLVMSAG